MARPLPLTGIGTTGKRFVYDPASIGGCRYWLRRAVVPGSDLVAFAADGGTEYALFIEVRTGCAYAVAL
jgi:hypothetical protein